MQINRQTVSFRISNELLFTSGQATLSKEGGPLIKKLAEVINRSKFPVSVEGHSDNVPILTRQFASNWDLSTSRATSVLRELVHDGVDSQRLRAVGYADTKPLESNDTQTGRAANRRVELIMRICCRTRTRHSKPSGGHIRRPPRRCIATRAKRARSPGLAGTAISIILGGGRFSPSA